MPIFFFLKAKKIYYLTQAAVERGRVSTQPIFSHLWGTDMNYRVK
jgi:hypothetical protein